jgi:hypothetical protein
MNYCPLMSFIEKKECFREHCSFAGDEANKCLIKQALQLYIDKERTHIKESQAMTRFSGGLMSE